MNALVVSLRRDLLLAGRRRGEILTALLFFVIVVDPVPARRRPGAGAAAPHRPGRAVGRALLASMLSLPRLFAADYADGTLEQMALSPQPLPLLWPARSPRTGCSPACRWSLLAPLLALQFGLDGGALARARAVAAARHAGAVA